MDKIFLPDLRGHFEEIRLQNVAEERRKEMISLMQPAPPFSAKEMTEEARQLRLKRSANSFWYWDKIYFPKEIYPNYAKPGQFHADLAALAELKDKIAHIIIGPRDTAKTVTLKKRVIYDFLHGSRRNMAVGSEVLTPATNFIQDMSFFLQNNPRIQYDYKLEFLEDSDDCLFARSEVNPKGTYLDALSMERSSKGRSRGIILRYDLIYLTDWENLTSSMEKEAVQKRVDKINEMRTSLSDNGTLIAEGNNFHPDCAQNKLLEEDEKGIISEYFKVHLYAAWDDKRPYKQRSLWPQRYPATSEEELRRMMKPADDIDWSGSFQGRPKLRSGIHFPETYYHEWDYLPEDLKTCFYTDPNTSLKEKGDTTAILCMGFSASMQMYYIPTARCRSYFDSNELLMDYLVEKRKVEQMKVVVIASAMDGNVTQESVWTNNILQFTRLHGFPFPYMFFRKYNVDDLVTSPSAEWKNNKFLFPPGFSKTEEGKLFLKQHFKFRTKKAKKKDDAPDSFICLYQFLLEQGISMTLNSSVEIHSVSNRQIKVI